MEAVRKVMIPFAISHVAQAAAVAALEAEQELLARVRARSSRSGPGCATRCSARGGEVPPTEANFVWLPLGERTNAFAEHCAGVRRGRAPVRRRGRPRLDRHAEENDAFLAAARSFLA